MENADFCKNVKVGKVLRFLVIAEGISLRSFRKVLSAGKLVEVIQTKDKDQRK